MKKKNCLFFILMLLASGMKGEDGVEFLKKGFETVTVTSTDLTLKYRPNVVGIYILWYKLGESENATKPYDYSVLPSHCPIPLWHVWSAVTRRRYPDGESPLSPVGKPQSGDSPEYRLITALHNFVYGKGKEQGEGMGQCEDKTL